MENKKSLNRNSNNSTSAIYVMGIVGAAIYFIGQATSFGMGIVGFLKALVWPVFLVYEALSHYGA